MSELAEQYYQEGIKALQGGVFPMAQEMFSKATKELPSRFEFWNLLGISHQFQKQWKQCDQAWREALRCKPDSVDVKLNLGIANIALGNESDAEVFWLSILDTDPNHIQTLINLGLFYRERDRNQEAHDFWERGLGLMPQNAKLREWIADVKGVLGWKHLSNKSPDKAEALLKQAVILDPEYDVLWRYLAEWHLRKSEFKDAEEACVKGLTVNPENENLKALRKKVLRVSRNTK
jgi:Tfp pilus assembly protein PilF